MLHRQILIVKTPDGQVVFGHGQWGANGEVSHQAGFLVMGQEICQRAVCGPSNGLCVRETERMVMRRERWVDQQEESPFVAALSSFFRGVAKLCDSIARQCDSGERRTW